jgi:thiamine-monophosphate kinase
VTESPKTPRTIADLGEFALIDRIRSLVAGRSHPDRGEGAPASLVIKGIGDDAAIMRPQPGWDWVFTCDVQVAGRHFVPYWTTPRAAGRRAMMVNLSDLAAMGAEPCGALVSLGLPGDLVVTEIEELYRGFHEALDLCGGEIIGGNLSSTGPDWFCDITLIGRIEQGAALLRSGARPGDKILVTGSPGRSAAGLALLQHVERRVAEGEPALVYPPGQKGASDPGRLAALRNRFSSELREFLATEAWALPLIEAHLAPTARVAAGRYLAGARVTSRPEGADGRSPMVTALIDTSDGLPGDLLRICEQSGVRALLEGAALFGDQALEMASRLLGCSQGNWLLGPSDDYELLLTVPPEDVEVVRSGLQSRFGLGSVLVGEISEYGEPTVEVRGAPPDLVVPAGWDHFRSPPTWPASDSPSPA